MKKIIALILALLLSLTLVACSGKDGGEKDVLNPDGTFRPWDKMDGGGGGIGGTPSSLSALSASSLIPVTEKMTATDEIDAHDVNLDNLSALPNGVSLVSGNVIISSAGTFRLSGTLVGSVIVENFVGVAKIVLNGVTINTPSASPNGAIMFNETNADRYIIVNEGTTNTVSDSAGNNANGAGGTIVSKKGKLYICGTGTLNVKAVGAEATGIKVKDDLSVVGTTLNIEAVKHGIKANDTAVFSSAKITITAGNDGIKTDKEGSTLAEAKGYASKPKSGYIYIHNTKLTITANDDGICANSGIFIDNGNQTIKITTNGGAPSAITDNTSASANGTAIKVEGISYVSGSTKTEVDSTHDNGYSLIVKSGTLEINSNGDALSSKGNLFVADGTLTLSSGDDALHARYLTKIEGGTLTVNKSYEAIEGAGVEITGGTVTVNAVEDGINANNSDASEYDCHVYISGGEVTVSADGDGVDSNGWVEIEGGTLIIHGPTANDNGSLDSDKGVLVTGGTLIAMGSSGMVENPSLNSTQYYVSVNLKKQAPEGSQISVYDDSDALVISTTSLKKFRSIVISLSACQKDKKITVTVGDETYSATLTEVGTALGTNRGGNVTQGARPGFTPPPRP